jgi:hypothetical protein
MSGYGDSVGSRPWNQSHKNYVFQIVTGGRHWATLGCTGSRAHPVTSGNDDQARPDPPGQVTSDSTESNRVCRYVELGGKLPRTVDNQLSTSSVVKITTKNVCRVTKQLETKYYTLVEVGRVLSSDSILVCVAGESHL